LLLKLSPLIGAMIDVLLETLLTLDCNRVPRQQGCFYFGDDADFDISSIWLGL
jgi:hypothetical protein